MTLIYKINKIISIGQAMPESKPVELEQLQGLLTKNGLVTQALK